MMRYYTKCYTKFTYNKTSKGVFMHDKIKYVTPYLFWRDSVIMEATRSMHRVIIIKDVQSYDDV